MLAIFRHRLGKHHPHTEIARRSLATLPAGTALPGSAADVP
jgi:hypothetical protein